MKLTKDFYNKLADKIRTKYFPGLSYHRDNPNCQKATYAIECFSNGVETYSGLISKLARFCKTSQQEVHDIAKELVTDFEGYKFKPKKQGMKISFQINDEVVKIFTDRGVKKKDIPKLYMHIIEEELGQNSHFRNDFITEWFDENDFTEVLQ